MNELRVLLVDDDAACLKEMRRLLASFPYVSVVSESLNTAQAIALLHQQKVDLVFLDIELGNESGFQLARHIHTAFPACKVIFLTGHVNFALEGYEYGPIDFLVKPIHALRLEQALLRAQEQRMLLREKEEVRIGIQSGNRLEIVSVRKILYMEKKSRQVLIVCENGEKIITRETLQKLEPAFLPHGFYRCHQSFLVALDRVRSIQLEDSKCAYTLLLEGTDVRIPLSRDRVSDLRHLLAESGLILR